MIDLLPPNATKQERDLSNVAQTIAEVDVPIDKLWKPLECPIDVLSFLAWALSVDDWDPNWTTAQKRQVVNNSVEVHRHKGTFGAVRKALEALGYGVVINENTGTPFTFRIAIDQNGVLNPDDALFEEATRIALKTKNARSNLAGVDVLLTQRGDVFWGTASTSGMEVSIYPPVNLLFETDHFPIMGSGAQHVDQVTLRN